MKRLNHMSRPFASSDAAAADDKGPDAAEGPGGRGWSGRSRGSWPTLGRQASRRSSEAQPKLVVKHTFLELTMQGDLPPEELELAVLSEQRRARAYTDTAVEYGSDTTPPCSSRSSGGSAGDRNEDGISPRLNVGEEQHNPEFTFELSGLEASFASTADGFEDPAPLQPPRLPTAAPLRPQQPAPAAEAAAARRPALQLQLQPQPQRGAEAAGAAPPGLQAPFQHGGLQPVCCLGPAGAGWLPWTTAESLVQVASRPPQQNVEFLNSLRAAELDVQAARLKVAALHLEEAAKQARMEAGVSRQLRPTSEGSGGDSSPAGALPGASTRAPVPTREPPSASEPAKLQTKEGSETEDARRQADETFTTVMLRHLPAGYTRAMLLNLLDLEGFKGCYDFVYLPVDFVKWQGFGYAFVNLCSHEEALRVWKHFDGFLAWPALPSAAASAGPQRACEVSWGDPLQGLPAHVERYRNSPVMHKDVPEQFKPACFANGVRTKFPPPTKRIRPPRLKHGSTAELSKCAAAPPER